MVVSKEITGRWKGKFPEDGNIPPLWKPLKKTPLKGVNLIAQIPNNGIENWTVKGNYMDPDGWSTYDAKFQSLACHFCCQSPLVNSFLKPIPGMRCTSMAQPVILPVNSLSGYSFLIIVFIQS